MFDPRSQSRRATACKVLVALIGAIGCLAAVAYAASVPSSSDLVTARAVVASADGRQSGAALFSDLRPSGSRPPRPRITRHPTKTSLSTSVSFRFIDSQAPVDFQCKLDRAGWKLCGSRVFYRGLEVGAHRFLVRAEGRSGRRSGPARFSWVQAEPKSFSITPDLSGLSELYPGAAPVALPLVLTNPNSSPIFITSLQVSVIGEPPGCASGDNLELTQSNASSASPLQIPAGGAVTLPAMGISAPAIGMRDLPVSQDVCQNAQFPLAFSGVARG
jgi:hypothetical protein